MSKKILPITRMNKFFSQDDFDLEVSFGREFIEEDNNFTVILYRVDREFTPSDDIYKEAGVDEISFHPPVELKVIPIIEDPENKVYNNNSGSLRYLEDGSFKFGIYVQQLTDLKVDLSFGDYIGYAINETTIRYFTVVNDGRKNYNNKHTILGYKGAFRSVTCAPVDENEFKAL
jgi:hypothetical protein